MKTRTTIITYIVFLIFVNFQFLYAVTQVNKDSVTVTFVMSAGDLPEDSSVFITGNIEQLGYWNPQSVKMEKTNSTWTKNIKVSNPIHIEYKFTLGSWEREGALPDGQPLGNFYLNVSNDTLVNNTVVYWTNRTRQILNGQITGTVEYHYSLWGKGIRERDIIVWLPPDYNRNASASYPVLYMHDGQNLFDPSTSTFRVDWGIDESADSLIRSNVIRPLIIVGIYNTPDRSREYTPGEKGSAYMSFVVNELKPYIDSVYRTLPGPENTFTGGSSAGGIVSFMLSWEYPNIFGGAICMSPAFKINRIDYTDDVADYSGEKKDLRYYIDNGGRGVDNQLQAGVDEMIELLKSKGFIEGKDFTYYVFPEAEHTESEWAKRVPAALEFLIGK